MSAHRERYTGVAIVLHWLMVIGIATQFGLGWYMGDLPKGPDRTWFFALHKSIGLTVASLALVRLIWRWSHRPPLLGLPAWQEACARFTHYGLYVFMFLQPVSGYLSSSFSGYETAWFGLPLPSWGWKDKPLNHLFNDVHEASSIALLSFIALHVAGAAWHAYHRDGVIGRILPRG
jgi:cytochrome b561